MIEDSSSNLYAITNIWFIFCKSGDLKKKASLNKPAILASKMWCCLLKVSRLHTQFSLLLETLNRLQLFPYLILLSSRYTTPSLAWFWGRLKFVDVDARLFNLTSKILSNLSSHGTRTCIKRKKYTMVNFLIFVQKNVSTIRFQEIKIRPLKGFEKMHFCLFTL